MGLPGFLPPEKSKGGKANMSSTVSLTTPNRSLRAAAGTASWAMTSTLKSFSSFMLRPQLLKTKSSSSALSLIFNPTHTSKSLKHTGLASMIAHVVMMKMTRKIRPQTTVFRRASPAGMLTSSTSTVVAWEGATCIPSTPPGLI